MAGDSGSDEGAVPTVGELLQHHALGSDATYRVVGENPRGIVVEVVEAPGLEPGFRITLTVEAATAMTRVSSAEARRNSTVPSAPPRKRSA